MTRGYLPNSEYTAKFDAFGPCTMATMATRYNSEKGGGGGTYFYELLMALYFF